MVIDGLWPGAWPSTAPQPSSRLQPVMAHAAQQLAIHGDGLTVVHHPRLGSNGSFFQAAIAFLRTVEAAEQAPVRTRPARNVEKATDNHLRQANTVQGALAAPVPVVPSRRRDRPRRRGAAPDQRKPKRD